MQQKMDKKFNKKWTKKSTKNGQNNGQKINQKIYLIDTAGWASQRTTCETQTARRFPLAGSFPKGMTFSGLLKTIADAGSMLPT
jgi:hypothetical protein